MQIRIVESLSLLMMFAAELINDVRRRRKSPAPLLGVKNKMKKSFTNNNKHDMLNLQNEKSPNKEAKIMELAMTVAYPIFRRLTQSAFRLCLCFFFISILIINLYANDISQKERDIFATIFNNASYEIVIIYCYDGTLFGYTNEQEGSVSFRISQLKDKLEKRGKKIDNIKIIIHNHLPNRVLCNHFSPSDRKQLQLLKNKGFKGLYALWVDGEITQTIK